MPVWEYKVIHLNIKNNQPSDAETASSATKGAFSPEYLKQEFPEIYNNPKSSSSHPARQLQQALNQLGKDGWELIEISEIGALTMMFFKRMKPESESQETFPPEKPDYS